MKKDIHEELGLRPGQSLELLQELQREFRFACLFVTHDLAVVDVLADRIVVMSRGHVVEEGSRDAILRNPQEPYTQRLIAAVPLPNPAKQRERREHVRRRQVHVLDQQPPALHHRLRTTPHNAVSLKFSTQLLPAYRQPAMAAQVPARRS